MVHSFIYFAQHAYVEAFAKCWCQKMLKYFYLVRNSQNGGEKNKMKSKAKENNKFRRYFIDGPSMTANRNLLLLFTMIDRTEPFIGALFAYMYMIFSPL